MLKLIKKKTDLKLTSNKDVSYSMLTRTNKDEYFGLNTFVMAARGLVPSTQHCSLCAHSVALAYPCTLL